MSITNKILKTWVFNLSCGPQSFLKILHNWHNKNQTETNGMLVQGCHQWWPYMDWSADQVFVAWITTTASPSKITSWRPISIVNWTARLHARASTFATDWGRGICIESAPMTAPLLSQITTPSPAELQLLKAAPSKLALYWNCSGGHQWRSGGT